MRYKTNEQGVYEDKSNRYQTKRNQELINKKVLQQKEYDQYLAKLKQNDFLTEDERDYVLMRITTLKHELKLNVKKPVYKGNYIPFYLDTRTIIFVKEEDCFTSKKTERFSKSFIEERIKVYKSLLHLKPANTPYWNPFAL